MKNLFLLVIGLIGAATIPAAILSEQEEDEGTWGDSCLADVNEDGFINIGDLTLVQGGLFETGCNHLNNWCTRNDVTRDGVVNINDLSAVRHWLFAPCDHCQVVTEVVNPAPALICHANPPIPPYSKLSVRRNTRPDIGAIEYIPPFVPVREGDISLDGKITPYDEYILNVCAKGSDVPYTTSIRKLSDGTIQSIACWLCDFDHDGDVDARDKEILLPMMDEYYLWGDADRNGAVDEQDAQFVCDCVGSDPFPNEGSPCFAADLNHTLTVNINDIALVEQALAQQN